MLSEPARPADPSSSLSLAQSNVLLQDIFYEKADALVGVARDHATGASKTFTFDLSAFGEPAEAT